MNNQAKPQDAPWLSAYLMVKDVDQSIDFYKRAFGFGVRDQAAGEDGSTWHAELTYQDQLVMCGKEGAWGTTSKSPATSGIQCPMSLYLYCDNVDQFFEKAIAAGATALAIPDDMFWGDRMCRLKDLNGYEWSFATHIGEHQ